MACNRPNQPPAQPPYPHAAHGDIDVELPCLDGMLAGTLALMTGYAEHQCEQGNANCRHLMAKKIVSNLTPITDQPVDAGANAIGFDGPARFVFATDSDKVSGWTDRSSSAFFGLAI
jgi:hypothetical protein